MEELDRPIPPISGGATIGLSSGNPWTCPLADMGNGKQVLLTECLRTESGIKSVGCFFLEEASRKTSTPFEPLLLMDQGKADGPSRDLPSLR